MTDRELLKQALEALKLYETDVDRPHKVGLLQVQEAIAALEQELEQPTVKQLVDEQVEAFREGILYAAKKYAATGNELFTGNDVVMFLEMEVCELEDDEIKEHLGVKK